MESYLRSQFDQENVTITFNGIDVMDMSRKQLVEALQFKELLTTGNKKQMRMRLLEVLQREREQELQYKAELEQARRAEAAIEEAGAVYAVGCNAKGQLGLGDLEPRPYFTCIRSTRGRQIDQVYAGCDYVFAITVEKEVYCWGGGGEAPLPVDPSTTPRSSRTGYGSTHRKSSMHSAMSEGSDGMGGGGFDATGAPLTVGASTSRSRRSRKGPMWASPVYVEAFRGEGIVQIGCGFKHCGAVSEGGDLYTWGSGAHGQLGINSNEDRKQPTLVEALQDRKTVLVAVSFHHSVAVTEHGQVYTWGHGSGGRLGLGTLKRQGVASQVAQFFPEPCIVPTFRHLRVMQVSCGAQHTAVIAEDGVYTWGSGDGGRLGHGDLEDRIIPTKVEALAGQVILQVVAGNWHTAAIVQFAPLLHGGQVFTWGSGYAGQLGQGKVTMCKQPQAIKFFIDRAISIVFVASSNYHMAALADDETMYTWGSNKFGCLGAEVEDAYCTEPKRVWDFDCMIDGIGRGPPRSIACGDYFTVVALHPYTGPTEDEIIAQEERAIAEAEAERIQVEKQALLEAAASKQAKAIEEAKLKAAEEAEKKLCTVCKGCSGFEPHGFNPNVCIKCNHPKPKHTRARIEVTA